MLSVAVREGETEEAAHRTAPAASSWYHSSMVSGAVATVSSVQWYLATSAAWTLLDLEQPGPCYTGPGHSPGHYDNLTPVPHAATAASWCPAPSLQADKCLLKPNTNYLHFSFGAISCGLLRHGHHTTNYLNCLLITETLLSCF